MAGTSHFDQANLSYQENFKGSLKSRNSTSQLYDNSYGNCYNNSLKRIRSDSLQVKGQNKKILNLKTKNFKFRFRKEKCKIKSKIKQSKLKSILKIKQKIPDKSKIPK